MMWRYGLFPGIYWILRKITGPLPAVAAVSVLAACASSLPNLSEPPPESHERKKAILIVRGGSANKPNSEQKFCSSFAKKCLSLAQTSGYFSEIELDQARSNESVYTVNISYSVAFVQPGQYHSHPNGLWGDLVDTETQVMCCLSGGIFPMHETYRIAIHFGVTDESGVTSSLSKERAWDAWSWQPYLVPVYANVSGRLQSALLELVAEAMQEARRGKLI